MEEQGHIEIRVDNVSQTLSPKDVDINDLKVLISDIETFLYPSRDEKKLRPHIFYDIQSGSAKHRFFLPLTAVLLFDALLNEIARRNTIDFLEYRRQEIIDRFQKKASKAQYIIEFKSSQTEKPSLTITPQTNFEMLVPPYYESEFYLYGEIYQEGGKNPNIHIATQKYGNLTVSATKEQIAEGEKKTYKFYGVKVRGKKRVEDGKLLDLKLLEFINYKPVFDKDLLNKVIAKASTNLNKIQNLDQWIEDLKILGL
ncbi:MAG: hypothetical protein ACOVQ4_21585 [Flectobacillus sp.]|uniref:hypothetical protein n=1 Tax=Flectobacillus sp. TaxID=50419 RepID=UPI003B999BD9